MKIRTSLICAILLLVTNTVCAVGQSRESAPPESEQQAGTGNEAGDYSPLIKDIFAPVTDDLNLTKEQQFQIVAIITSEWVKAYPVMQQLKETNQQLTEVTFTEPFDSSKAQDLVAQQVEIMTELIAIKVLAKARIYQVLTPDQKSLVTQRLHSMKPQSEKNAPGLSMY